MKTYIKEACVESLEQALLAEKNGANRIELCADLDVGGLTPSKELILQVKSRLKIPIHVMVRPRAGNFVYSELEIEQMISDIQFCKNTGIEGVVLGVLQDDKTINFEAILRLAKVAKPLKIIFHKAIDESQNILNSVIYLRETGVIDGILTSGGKNTAAEAVDQLKNIFANSGNMEIICAGKITAENLKKLHREVGATAYHGRKIVSGLY